MNKSLILRITGAVAALVSLVPVSKVPDRIATLFNALNYGISPLPLSAFVLSEVVAPIVLLAFGVLVAIPLKKLSGRRGAALLIIGSSLSFLAWPLPTLTGGFESFFDRLVFSFDYETGERTISGSTYSAVVTLALLGVSIWLFATSEKQEKTEADLAPKVIVTGGFAQFLGALVDSKLENFISRRVSGVLYIITAWLIIAAAVLSELGLIIQVLEGNFVALVAMLLVPLITLLTLIIVRMAFEAGIALIVIAENTKK
jgi:hypothetical protein